MKVLVVIDMQNDFIDGSLGTEEAKLVVGNVVRKIQDTKGKKEIMLTMDTHDENYLETFEGRSLPISHCIFDTEGWHLHKDIKSTLSGDELVFTKKTFGSVELAERLAKMDAKEKIEEIELVGICTDICVISNALLIKAFLPETPIAIDASCCAGVTRESHRNALEAMKMCHIEIQHAE